MLFLNSAKSCCTPLLGIALVVASATSSVLAGYTSINAPYPGEKTIGDILNHVYNDSFVHSGVDYSGTNYVAHRVTDFNLSLQTPVASAAAPVAFQLGLGSGQILSDGAQPIPGAANAAAVSVISTSAVDDQYWSAQSVVATAKARYAQMNQSFGYFDGTTGSQYHQVLAADGSEFNVTGSGTLSNLTPIFRFGRDGKNGVVSSAQIDNDGDIDHLVTYEISPVSSLNNGTSAISSVIGTHMYMLFWEDAKPDAIPSPDYDYNDLAVEIVITPSAAAAVPEPASIATVLALGGGLIVGRRRFALARS